MTRRQRLWVVVAKKLSLTNKHALVLLLCGFMVPLRLKDKCEALTNCQRLKVVITKDKLTG